MSKVKFEFPVQKMCGAPGKKSPVIFRCTADGGDISYLKGERDYEKHPVSQEEAAAKELFKRRQAAVSKRVDHEAETYAEDMAAYRAQLKGENPVIGFRKYVWSLVKAEIVA